MRRRNSDFEAGPVVGWCMVLSALSLTIVEFYLRVFRQTVAFSEKLGNDAGRLGRGHWEGVEKELRLVSRLARHFLLKRGYPGLREYCPNHLPSLGFGTLQEDHDVESVPGNEKMQGRFLLVLPTLNRE